MSHSFAWFPRRLLGSLQFRTPGALCQFTLLLFLGLAACWAGRVEAANAVAGKPAVFAVVFRLDGALTASGPDGNRALRPGDPVAVGERVVASAHGEGVLKTRDGGYIAIRPGAEFVAERFAADGNPSDNSQLNLFKGALRIISGWIGKVNRQGSRVSTSTATIGIRGTDHEPYVLLDDDAQVTQFKPGTYDKVNQGGTTLQAAGQSIDIDPGKVGFARSPGKSRALMTLLFPVLLDKVPAFYVPGKFDAELDEYRALSENSTDALDALEQEEKKRSGLSALKFGYNRVHGYYIELSRAQSTENIPAYFQRKQTLKNTERYITAELKTFEERVLSAQSKALSRERWLYDNLLNTLQAHITTLTHTAHALAEADVLNTLAERANTLHWNAPNFVDEPGIDIHEGRHPVLESLLNNAFIANDVTLVPGSNTLLITGPNMGGKSTYMRQTALIIVLAHIGSYVPARQARLGPIDKLFTRIGANDDLASGRSTFMVEMTETAYILRHATAQSLVLIDEIGRGTSTFDGVALAHACCVYLAETVQAFTLFSTHYFELTALPETCRHIQNVHVEAAVSHGKIVFLYRVKQGAASQSYGLEVAALAGIPQDVLVEARTHLQHLEPSKLYVMPEAKAQPKSTKPSAALAKIKALDLDEVTPRDALRLLYQIQALTLDEVSHTDA